MMTLQRAGLSLMLIAALAAGGAGAPAEKKKTADASGTIYVPVYPAIFHGDRERQFKLAVTLSIHNIDTKRSVTIERVDFHRASGELISRYLSSPREMRPLQTVNFVVRESDNRGGPGANFIIAWRAVPGARRPLAESIMIGTAGQQGISFTSRGVAVDDR